MTMKLLALSAALAVLGGVAQAANVSGCIDAVAGDYPRETISGTTNYNRATGYTLSDAPPIDGASSTYSSGLRDELSASYPLGGSLYKTTLEVLAFATCIMGQTSLEARNLTFARAWTESSHRQWFYGDNGQSCGILQVKGVVHDNTWPKACSSTLANALYSLGWQKACRAGQFSWIGGDYSSAIAAGRTDYVKWGCVGAWYSGNWYDADAKDYISTVQTNFLNKPWPK